MAQAGAGNNGGAGGTGGVGGNGGNGNTGGAGGAGGSGTPNGAGANGGYGGNGGNAGNAGSGGLGGQAGAGGNATGGAVYASSVAVGTSSQSTFISQSTFSGDSALAGNAGSGGPGGNGNTGGTGGDGASGGAGGGGPPNGNPGPNGNGGNAGLAGSGNTAGNGNVGGNAQAGSVYNATTPLNPSILVEIIQTSFTGETATAGAGGAGGQGGTGGNASQGGIGAAGNGIAQGTYGTNSSGGNPGAAGAGEAGGFVEGGALVNLIGSLILNNDTFKQNTATSGAGGQGGQGGTGGANLNVNRATGAAIGVGINGANGNIGGVSGSAQGGAMYSSGGAVAVTTSTFTSNLATVGQGGTGGTGGTPGAGSLAQGNGGAGANAGDSGFAQGGALAITAGSLTVTSSTFGGASAGNQVIGAQGGTGGKGGVGAVSGNSGTSGINGGGGGGGEGSAVYGGAIAASDNVTNVTLTGTAANPTLIENNSITSGTGGTGGANGTGGRVASPNTTSGSGANSGVAYGGGLSYHIETGSTNTATSTVSISFSTFGNNTVTTHNGGGPGATNGGFTGGSGASATYGISAPGILVPATYTGGRGGGLALINEIAATNLTVTSSSFTSNQITGGSGTSGSAAVGGGIDMELKAEGAATLSASQITSNVIVAGQGSGNGGLTAGGGLAASNTNLTLNSITVNGNSATSGAGRSNAGTANGGGIAATFSSGNPNATATFTLTSSSVTNNTLIQGNGIAGSGANAGSANGLAGADGAGVSVSFLSAVAAGSGVSISNSHLDGNIAKGGTGGTGPNGVGAGFNGGLGGAALGGGLFVNNSSNSALTIALSNDTASNNQLAAGQGGAGGNAGPGGQKNNVPGGNGGIGGNAEGGGIFLYANTNSGSVNTNSISNSSFNGNAITAGAGGAGGAGASNNALGSGNTTPNFAAGGQGGNALGGGIYSNSLNAATSNSLSVYGVTLAGNVATAGAGGIGGTGTTSNGGPGGDGGNAGNAEGGGLYEGGHAQLTVINTTIGGLSSDPNNPNVNFNILVAANGGRGGNAGTAGNTLSYANGGNGGAGSTLAGAGVYVDNGSATFINDTIDSNQGIVSLTNGAGGIPGGGAGTGSTGSSGQNGASNGGGYFANAGTNTIGNTILALDTAGSNITNTFTDPDVWGTFTSLGNNIIGVQGKDVFGLVPSDRVLNASLAQQEIELALGALRNNGGPTMTEALLHNGSTGSIAIGTGNPNLVTNPPFPPAPFTDQRGQPRLNNGQVDVGAFEVQPSSPINVSPTSLSNGIVGAGYNQTITASGGTGTLSVAYNVTSGTIPSGLNFILNGSQLAITGTPTTAGTVGFTLSVLDDNGDQLSQNYTLTINPATITLSPSTLPAGTTGQAYNQTITAGSNGSNNLTVTYSISSGTIPTGLTFTITGDQLAITGTPTTAGTVAFSVTAKDAYGDQTMQNYTLTVNVGAITFSPATLPQGIVGTNYNQNLTASGGNGPSTVTYKVTSSTTPASLGLTFTTSTNQLAITGVPTAAGTITFTVTGTDASNDTGSQNYTLTIDPAISFSPATLPQGIVGTAYSQTIATSGGSGGLTVAYTVTSTTKPSDLGLTFTTSNNQLAITGTPTATGNITFTLTATDSNGDKATRNYSLIINPAIVFSPTTLPPGSTYSAYSQTIAASGGSGGLTVAYTVTSTTKPSDLGLTFTTSNNQLAITGTPTVAGTITFTATATDSNGDTGSQNYTLTINASPITFSPTTLPAATTGSAYNQTLTASGGSGALTVTYNVTSTTKPSDLGLTFAASGNKLTITGTPTAAGTISFTVTGADGSGDQGMQNYTLTVNAGPITFSPTTLPSGATGQAYSQTITAGGGGGPLTVTYTVTSGTIPSGLTFTTNGNQLTISGTPTVPGTVTFNVTASDGISKPATQPYTLNVSVGQITFNPASLPNGTTGQVYNQTLTASGGNGPLSVTDTILSSTQPSDLGLAFTIVNNHLIISGTPTAAGTISFTVTGADGFGNQGTMSYTLTVKPGVFTFSPSTLPLGTAGTAYSQAITASGGTGTVTMSYTITSGSIPAGLSFTPSGNQLLITGTPSAGGTVSFTVTATDSNSETGSQNYTLTVAPVPPPPPPPPPSPTFSTTTTIVSVQNQYPGFVQAETVVVEVTNSAGIPINEGVVTFQVDNQTVTAPVIDGVATATIDSGLLDFSLLADLLFAHPLTANYSGSSDFGPSSTGTTVPPILLDFFFYEIALELATLSQLTQFQL